MEKFVNGDVLELTLLRPAHGGASGKGYDDILWSFLQDLRQTLRGRTRNGCITCAQRWTEQPGESGTLRGGGEHRSISKREELVEDPGFSSLHCQHVAE